MAGLPHRDEFELHYDVWTDTSADPASREDRALLLLASPGLPADSWPGSA